MVLTVVTVVTILTQGRRMMDMMLLPIMLIPVVLILAGVMLSARHKRNNPNPPVKTVVTIFGYSPENVKPGGPIKRALSILLFFLLIGVMIAIKLGLSAILSGQF
jgi:hypothetical protein